MRIPNDDGDPSDAELLTVAETTVVAPGSHEFVSVPISPTYVDGAFFVAAAYYGQTRFETAPPLDSSKVRTRAWFVSAPAGGLNVNSLRSNQSLPSEIGIGQYLIRARWQPEDSGEDWYVVAANAGDQLTIQTTDPIQRLNTPTSLLDPYVELYDENGARLVSATGGAGDGRHVRLSYDVQTDGLIRVVVRGENDSSGAYILDIDETSVVEAQPFVVTSSLENKILSSFPNMLRLDVSQTILPSGVAADDVTINGIPALAVTVSNSSTIDFQLDPLGATGDGVYEVSLRDGAITDQFGIGNLEYRTTFQLDSVGPRLLSTSVDMGGLVPSGPLQISLQFDEQLDEDSLSSANISLVGDHAGNATPKELEYDSESRIWSIRFEDLAPDERYDLILRSGDNGLRDLAGNPFDGEYQAIGSGNGLPGGDYVISFRTDVTGISLTDSFYTVDPAESLAFSTSVTGMLAEDDLADEWSLALPESYILSVAAIGDLPLVELTLLDRSGQALEQASTGAPLEYAISQGGDYSVRVSVPDTDTAIDYTLEFLVGAVFEREEPAGDTNDLPADAESLDNTIQALAPDGVGRTAVAGVLGANDDVDHYALTLVAGQGVSLLLDAPEIDEIQVEMMDGAETLATGRVTGNADQFLSFVPANSGVFQIRVTGRETTYKLAVVRNAVFDREGNNRPRHAQDLTDFGVAVGRISVPPGTYTRPTTESVATPVEVPSEFSVSYVARPPQDAPHESGRLLVKFREHIPTSDRTRLVRQWGGNVVEEISPDTYVVTVADDDIVELSVAWSAQPQVDYAEPDYILAGTDALPLDPLVDRIFGFDNIGQIGGTPGADIDAPQAWDVVTGTRRVVLANIDSGVDYFHPDLAANIWVNPNEIPGDGIDNDGNGYIDDIHGIDAAENDSDPISIDSEHGTHTAGTMGAVGNNGIGVSGVNWDVQIMVLRLNDPDGEFTVSRAVKLVNYMTMMKNEYGINIVASNNSYGGTTFSNSFYEAIRRSNEAGIAFVASAGNSNRNTDQSPHYPGSYDLPGVITVAATDKNDTTDSVFAFTNYGSESVDLGAPGTTVLSTVPFGDYAYFSGTSMAAPMVSGAIGLLKGIDPDASVAEIKDVILASTDPLDGLAGRTVSGGRLNLANAVAAIADDYYRLNVQRGQVIRVETLAPQSLHDGLSQLDPAIELFDPTGQLVGDDDNSGTDQQAKLLHRAEMDGEYMIRVRGAAAGTKGSYVLTAEAVTTSQVVGRHLFYNNSGWDRYESLATPDDDRAIAVDKHPLDWTNPASFENYSSFVHGINGIMVDVSGLAIPQQISSDDFRFYVGNDNSPRHWEPAPQPTMALRVGGGIDGSDRFTFVWPDGAIQNEWLQVTVRDTSRTNIMLEDVHYWGHALAEVGNDPHGTVVDTQDAQRILESFAAIAQISNPFDIDRDAQVNAVDVRLAEDNATTQATSLLLIDGRGDLNRDGATDDHDIDLLSEAVRGDSSAPRFDFNQDGMVDVEDRQYLIQRLMRAATGDANLDGIVDTIDFAILSDHLFMTDTEWADGDFNGDGVTDVRDFHHWLVNRSSPVAAATGPTRVPRAPLAMVAWPSIPADRGIDGSWPVASVDALVDDSDVGLDLGNRPLWRRWTAKRRATIQSPRPLVDGSLVDQILGTEQSRLNRFRNLRRNPATGHHQVR